MLFTNDECDAFARADGFKDEEDMQEWFQSTHGLPFKGDLVKWEWSAI